MLFLWTCQLLSLLGFSFGSFLDFYFQVSIYGLKCNHEREQEQEQEHVVICMCDPQKLGPRANGSTHGTETGQKAEFMASLPLDHGQ